jgi:hypothetical protein
MPPTGERAGVGVGIRLVDAPVSRRDEPRAHLYIVDHVNPGTTIRRRVMVTNLSGLPQRISVYPAAAAVDAGGFDFAPGRTGNELTSWVRLDRSKLDLSAGGAEMVWVTVAVPRTASAGERYAVLWAQVGGSGTDRSANVHHVGRAGIRIYLSVGPGGEPVSDFQIERVTGVRNAEGVPIVTVTVRNTGGRALDLNGELSLSDGPGGLSAGPFSVKIGTVGLGDSASVNVPLDRQVPDGSWAARVTLATDRLVTRKATATVVFGPAVARPAAKHNSAVLTLAGALAALTAALLGGYAYRRRRRA